MAKWKEIPLKKPTPPPPPLPINWVLVIWVALGFSIVLGLVLAFL